MRSIVTLNQDQTLNGIVYINNLHAKDAYINTLTCDGPINNNNFNAMIQDTITQQENVTITGHKHFITLSGNNLVVKEGIDLRRILSIINGRRIFTMRGDIVLWNSTIENIHFENFCNGFIKKRFEKMWTLHDGDTFYGDFNFNKVTVPGQLYIHSDYINTVSVTELSEKTVKTDEPFHFNSATFGKFNYVHSLFYMICIINFITTLWFHDGMLFYNE